MLIRRTYRFLVASAGLTISHCALAIGVGDIVVNSYVNEPLSADIAILDPKDLADSEVIASLASLADFERLGIERHYSLGSLVFETNMRGRESSSVRVRTEEPIREPYLNFLVELKWPEGRVLREYTVFLDLRPMPQFSPAQSRFSQGKPLYPENGLKPGQYRVAPNDTLSAIARRFREDGVSINQMMIAIKDANPGKFLRNNINGIRAGVLLDIPSAIDGSLSARDAAKRVVAQLDEWKRPAASRGLRIVADNEIGAFEESVLDTDLAADKDVASDAGSTTTVASASLTPESQPNLSSGSSTDLAAIEARLMMLSDQLNGIRGVVASKDEEIALLKAELAKRPVQSASVPNSVVAQPTESPQVKANDNKMVWALLIIALAGVAYISRRWFRGWETADSDASTTSTADDFAASLGDLLPVRSQGEPISRPSEPEAAKAYGESLPTSYAADQSLADAIAEADIYISFGRHQNALDTLEAASAAEPTNASGLLKMLDIYISLDRVEEAHGLMAAIKQTGDSDAISLASGKLSVTGDVLEGDSAAGSLFTESEVVESEATNELDLSLDLEFQEAGNSMRAVPEESDTSGMLDSDEDPAETALDLARAYLDMGDKAGAKDLLETAISMGDEAQVEVAKQLLRLIE